MKHPTIPFLRSILALGLLTAVSCDDAGSTNSCDKYVDYMCDCHSDEYDCAQLETTYAYLDSSLQHECAISLEDQEDEDGSNPDFSCGDTGSAAG